MRGLAEDFKNLSDTDLEIAKYDWISWCLDGFKIVDMQYPFFYVASLVVCGLKQVIEKTPEKMSH